MARGKRVRERSEKITFSRFDAAEYLKSEKDMVLFLEAAMEEAGDDPAFIADALGTIARARGITQLAKEVDLTREGLYRSLSKDGEPSFETIWKVIRALGMRLTVEAA
jgi:probable addiction module antidote protein